MTKQEKLDAIYEAMADKTLSQWCKVFYWSEHIVWDLLLTNNDQLAEPQIIESIIESDWYEIIWHPVRIGDVLKYIDTNCCFVDYGEWNKSRDMEALDSMLRAVFYSFVGKQDRPIDEQDESCVEYIFSLIK